ncbi:MAG: glutamate 5-kinase [Pseudomonadales bacterium]|nr:glutamate 5-kinase [Pseudomonadales bacterium]
MLKEARRIVVKVGSSLVTNQGKGLDHVALKGWAEQIVRLKQMGKEVVLVSSGAIAEGMQRLNWNTRPTALYELQAAAAVGQMGLAQAYAASFDHHELKTAQILLTHGDLSNRERYLNARSTLMTLLKLEIIPIINENDTVVTDEIRFGDNDTLGALVANLIEANTLLLLTDQDGFYESDPRSNPDAVLISERPASDPDLDARAGDGGVFGRGGMATKLRAARTAARSGANTVIASGRRDHVIADLLRGEYHGTLLRSDSEVLVARKQWLAALPPAGSLVLDGGAVRVLRQDGRSLLPVGVKAVRGEFTRGSMVSCVTEEGREIARGLVNYSSQQAAAICGQPSTRIESILGYIDDEELIHRDNLVMI